MPIAPEVAALQEMAAELGLRLKGPGTGVGWFAKRAATKATAVANAGQVAALGELVAGSGVKGLKVGGPGIGGAAGLGSKFARGAGWAAGGAFGVDMLTDWIMSFRERQKAVGKLGRALEDPWELSEAFAEDYVEQETAKKIEAARMRKLQEVAMLNPQMYASLHSRAAGDTIPHLGPGEARIGGSAWHDDEVLDRALANSDIWED